MIASLLGWFNYLLALPEFNLGAVFIVSFISATILPLGSEPVVFAAIKFSPHLFWPVILIATLGNTLGGMLDYWMGDKAHEVFASKKHSRWFGWLERFGAKALLLAWLPGIGDPICLLAGWLILPFWPSVGYMALGKFLRYLTFSWLLLNVSDSFWLRIIHWFS
jgi:membrane protein YqaA with SNARE-associated domain